MKSTVQLWYHPRESPTVHNKAEAEIPSVVPRFLNGCLSFDTAWRIICVAADFDNQSNPERLQASRVSTSSNPSHQLDQATIPFFVRACRTVLRSNRSTSLLTFGRRVHQRRSIGFGWLSMVVLKFINPVIYNTSETSGSCYLRRMENRSGQVCWKNGRTNVKSKVHE